ncbi:hypothetical protein Clacol_001979 [Clathrus columnatus]|uniref:Uncharacterized protein n=1 Tax=Clathrus columnatus TaxID=1419009 RepID=A0AAV5A3D6_9AGAM|nr:hypothetical protein Clacol_001979 [Clathrus columnatus]
MTHDHSEAEWHSIRPWSHRIAFQVREITSVSITFILRSVVASHSEALATLGEDSDDDEDTRVPTILDALNGGLVVKVNDNHWQPVIVNVDDNEEAIVIVYGLHPRKRYEIQLHIVAYDEHIVEEINTTSVNEIVSVPPLSTVPDPENRDIPPTLTPPMTPVRSSPPRPINPEERAPQLRKQISLFAAEREDLISQLKITRRESQRTEAALKSEIESLKRASEKHSAVEHRTRQKVLALQEAVKQANTAASDIEQKVKGIEDLLPSLNQQAKEAQTLHNRTKRELERKKTELGMSLGEGTKAVQNLQGELNTICVKMDKLTGKKEKLEKETIPHLEEKLKELRDSLERLEVQNDDERHDEESHSTRNWVSPIQRPSPQQRSSFPPSISFGSNNVSGRHVFHSPHLSDFTSYGSSNIPALLSSYSQNLPSRDSGKDHPQHSSSEQQN